MSFSVKNISLKQKCLQLNNNYQNFVFGVVFDIHQLKLGSALQKTFPVGLTISSFFGGVAVVSAGTRGSEQAFQTMERFLNRPRRLWK